MSHISTAELASIGSITKRQVQRTLERKGELWGAVRTSGGHWSIPDSPAVREWFSSHCRWNKPDGKRASHILPDLDSSIFTSEGVIIPADTQKREWKKIHKTILAYQHARKSRRGWLMRSRAFAMERWGEDYLAESEVQMETALGIEPPKESPKLNPADKSSAIVTIEGISQQFTLWHRKMDAEIAGWNKSQIEKAIGLLEPQARLLAELTAMRGRLKGGK
jgi:hypothetical protein